jgi:hypothetical protein
MRRFGDPAVPKWRVGRASSITAGVALLAFVIFVPVLAYVSIEKYAKTADVPHLVGTIVGIVLTTLVLVASLLVWFWIWLPLLWRLRTLRRESPKVLVMAARLPPAAREGLIKGWPSRSPSIPLPRTVVLLIDNVGISFWARSNSPIAVLQLRWSEIHSVIAAEYVDGRLAYEGLAIVSPSNEVAIALQLVEAAPTLVRFVSGKQLVKIATKVEALRPKRAEQSAG